MRRGFFKVAAAWLVAAAVVAACASFDAEESAPTPVPEAGIDDGPKAEGDAAASDADAADVVVVPPSDASGACDPTAMHRFLVRGSSFCIDRTEVTEEAYAQFVLFHAQARPDVYAQLAQTGRVPPSCPLEPVDPGLRTPDGGQLPVRRVGFCSAAIYCAYRGKRICGSVADGGPIAPFDDARIDEHEWVAACTNGGTDPAPFPAGTDAGCRLGTDAGPFAVGTSPACGRDGVVDQIGNLWEWAYERNDSKPGTSYTRVVGGGFESQLVEEPCRLRHSVDGPPDAWAGPKDDVGFRCCATPTD